MAANNLLSTPWSQLTPAQKDAIHTDYGWLDPEYRPTLSDYQDWAARELLKLPNLPHQVDYWKLPDIKGRPSSPYVNLEGTISLEVFEIAKVPPREKVRQPSEEFDFYPSPNYYPPLFKRKGESETREEKAARLFDKFADEHERLKKRYPATYNR